MRRSCSGNELTRVSGPNQPARTPGVIASSATGIVSWIERLNGDVDGIFGRSGIAPEMAGSPTLVLDLKSFCRLFEESAKSTRTDNFGLLFGSKFEPRDLGLWGYAALSAPSVEIALSTLIELFPLHQQSSTMRLTRDTSGMMRLDYRIESAAIVERRQDAELTLAQILCFIRSSAGTRWSPEEVHFEHPRPENWREHEDIFGAPVFLSRPSNSLLFKPTVLTVRMRTHDPRLMVAMQQCLRELASRNNLRASIADQVRAAIRARLADGPITLETIASELRLAPGHIQRESETHTACDDHAQWRSRLRRLLHLPAFPKRQWLRPKHAASLRAARRTPLRSRQPRDLRGTRGGCLLRRSGTVALIGPCASHAGPRSR